MKSWWGVPVTMKKINRDDIASPDPVVKAEPEPPGRERIALSVGLARFLAIGDTLGQTDEKQSGGRAESKTGRYGGR